MGDEAHFLLVEEVAPEIGLGITRNRQVGEDDVERMGLELPQLDAQRGGGDVQVLGRAGQVARLRDRAEVAEVMVVEEGHGMFELIKRSN